MNREDIIRIAQEAGLHIATDVNWMPIIGLKYAEKFAALVASAERERINAEAKAHLQELRNNFDVESTKLRLHMWSKEKQA